MRRAMAGAIIKQELKRQGRSQVWLAEQLGCPAWRVSHMLQGRRVYPGFYRDAALLLGIPITQVEQTQEVSRKART